MSSSSVVSTEENDDSDNDELYSSGGSGSGSGMNSGSDMGSDSENGESLSVGGRSLSRQRSIASASASARGSMSDMSSGESIYWLPDTQLYGLDLHSHHAAERFLENPEEMRAMLNKLRPKVSLVR